MKLVLAILCSFVLAAASLLPAQTLPPMCAKQSLPACCQHGRIMPCCRAEPVPHSSSLPAGSAPVGSRCQLAFVPSEVTAVRVLPDVPALSFSSAQPATFPAASNPLYALNCARLI